MQWREREPNVKYAAIGPIAVYLPETVETNEMLQTANPSWNMPEIAAKTGILQRHVASPEQCSSDLAVAAAEKLFHEHAIDRQSIDYVLFCTQTPDYYLPTTACLIQDRLGLRQDIGALDFNLGCSGYVYGLSLADGLIRAGVARRILLLTAETYTKLIHPSDRSLRTIFGDAGAATLVESADQPTLLHFQFGTDGSGANTLIASGGGFRSATQAIAPRHKKRWPSALYMDGPELITFTVAKIPHLVETLCRLQNIDKDQIHRFFFHQATYKLLDELRRSMSVAEEKMPVRMEQVGNTVCCTLPILIEQMRREEGIPSDRWNILVGFGVGLSWAGCLWRDHLAANG
jgi:3-oxoacyl-[acyl-carrier-protein] synthase-3